MWIRNQDDDGDGDDDDNYNNEEHTWMTFGRMWSPDVGTQSQSVTIKSAQIEIQSNHFKYAQDPPKKAFH